MRAAVLHAAGEAMSLEPVHLAGPGPGEVRVKVTAAGVCHSDLHYMTGDLGCRLPAVLGHEGTGLVEQAGPGVTRVRPGDVVVFMWRPRCGQCEFCLTGRPALCPAIRVPVATGGLLDGTSRLSLADGRPAHHFLGVSCFADYCVVAQESVVKIPPQTPSRIAAVAGCAVVTGVGAVLNLMGAGTVQPGQGVLVIGAGGVGLSAVMGAVLSARTPSSWLTSVRAAWTWRGPWAASHLITCWRGCGGGRARGSAGGRAVGLRSRRQARDPAVRPGRTCARPARWWRSA